MFFAPFTDAVKRFFERARWGGRSVPCVFAGPDRAFEEMARVQKRRSQGRKSGATGTTGLTFHQIGERPAWVPFMSILIQPPEFDAARFNPRSFRGVTKDIEKGTATTMRFPRPVNADVQVDLWSAGNGGWGIAQHVAAQIELQFTAESVYLPIDWADPRWWKPPFDALEHARAYGRTRIRLVSSGWSDTSDLEAGDGPKRIRWTWSGRIEGYLPYRLDEARLVREIAVDVEDAATGNTLDEYRGGVED